MAYEVVSRGEGKWDVKQDGVTLPDAHVKRIEFPEVHRDLPDGRKAYQIAGPARATVRLPDGREATDVPVTFPKASA